MGSTDIRYINKNQQPASLPTYKLIKQKLQFVAQKTRRKTPENFPVSESMTAAKQWHWRVQLNSFITNSLPKVLHNPKSKNSKTTNTHTPMTRQVLGVPTVQMLKYKNVFAVRTIRRSFQQTRNPEGTAVEMIEYQNKRINTNLWVKLEPELLSTPN